MNPLPLMYIVKGKMLTAVMRRTNFPLSKSCAFQAIYIFQSLSSLMQCSYKNINSNRHG